MAAITLLVLAGCGKKKNRPFCFNCENGKLVEAYSNGWPYSIFIKENGDTLSILTHVSDVFKKEGGVNVCAKLKKHKGLERAIYMYPTYNITCITKTE